MCANFLIKDKIQTACDLYNKHVIIIKINMIMYFIKIILKNKTLQTALINNIPMPRHNLGKLFTHI